MIVLSVQEHINTLLKVTETILAPLKLQHHHLCVTTFKINIIYTALRGEGESQDYMEGCSITTISQESLCWMCVVTLSSSRIINKGLDLFWWTAILSLFPVFDLIVWSCGMKTTSSTPSAFYNNTVAINFFADWIWEFHYDVCFQFWNQPWSQKLHYSPRPYQCAPFQKLYLVFFFGIQS